MGIKAPIFRCMASLNCQEEEYLYSPKDIEHHLNTKHTTFVEQAVPEHDKIWVYVRNSTNLFDVLTMIFQSVTKIHQC
ncbi:3636_t:CDS:2 [Entrophospora sp. SA101]|nr:3636_t:CDS:2 [Entrophospora sp. SA101]